LRIMVRALSRRDSARVQAARSSSLLNPGTVHLP
jgi:hypothetical protein